MTSNLTLGLIVGCLAPGLSAETLNPIVVTPTRTAQTVDETNASVTVISREDIERSTATSVQDVLRSVPGVSVTDTGGAGKQSSVFIRGSNSDHVLVLVDGMKVGGATAGTAQLENIPLALVDHIEVVRGPRSSLYGSEAIGGVIQIFTRRGTLDPEAISEVSAGNNGTARLTQHFSGTAGDTRYSLSASLYDTDGVDSQPASNQRDDDGFTSKSVSASLDQQVTDDLSLGLNLMHAQGENDYDDGSRYSTSDQRYWNEFIQQSGRVFADYSVSDRVSLHGQVGFGRETNENHINLSPYYDYETKRQQYLLQSDIELTDYQLLTLGVERIDESVDASTDYTEDSRYNNAAFAQWQTLNQPLHVEASARYDDNEAYGEETTGALSVGYMLSEVVMPYVSYGTGFKAPNFNDLYSPFGANPDLKAETSETYEVGMKGSAGRLSYELSFYRTNFDDLVVLDSLYVPYNVGKATAKGSELSLAYTGIGWSLEAGAGYTRATDDETGDPLGRRPKWNGRLAGSRTFGPTEVNLELLGRTDSIDTAAGDAHVPGYVVANLSLGYAATEALNLGLKVSNLLDQEAVTAYGYAGQTRQVLASLRYTY
ncbi:TonB-dependent receptor [Marinobacter sp. R17]|uniref:TonB-dependent receptor domain-containing protein n=1 Tax=Marinobacter sp. R17 TaxID=2484250 RepID=UPI000FBC73F3|nr:TonB-dependent receptor [Marinobacter sp. R17]ROT93605.1 TonB-dependent receptor [Marinobacter sp. R17]